MSFCQSIDDIRIAAIIKASSNLSYTPNLSAQYENRRANSFPNSQFENVRFTPAKAALSKASLSKSDPPRASSKAITKATSAPPNSPKAALTLVESSGSKFIPSGEDVESYAYWLLTQIEAGELPEFTSRAKEGKRFGFFSSNWILPEGNFTGAKLQLAIWIKSENNVLGITYTRKPDRSPYFYFSHDSLGYQIVSQSKK